MEGRKGPVIIIGGGASGISAAIAAKSRGAGVVVCERMDRLGRKILASGNGRCNLSNDKLESSRYNPAAKRLVDSVFSRFGSAEIRRFFEGLGLCLYSESGRVFPATNQSSTVLKVLEMELGRLSILVEYGFQASKVVETKSGFVVLSASGRKIAGGAVILACGGRSYPALGSDGSAYGIAKSLGHTVIEPAPSAVPLTVKDQLCHSLQGQKIIARVKSIIGGSTGDPTPGDLLFTKYGLSGTAILDISREISIAVNRDKARDVFVSVDMVPFMDEAELAGELAKRLRRGVPAEDLIAGILPNKFGTAMSDLLRVKEAKPIAKALKDRRFKVLGTRGWNEADFTAGGVDPAEIGAECLSSLVKRGLYFAGEILDVDGDRGGYNLAWAWASGHVAGRGAADCVA
ncbi:MAG: aminoacetone oxidase family FAD-binding enzyme [Candidatus Omnitrophota bacterium]